MINTKLIFVDGITGSGKSTTAHFLARQLEKNGIKTKWFYENEKDHPLYNIEWNGDKNIHEYYLRNMLAYPNKWNDFINSIKDDDCVYIVESYLFQYQICGALSEDCEKETIKQFILKLCSLAACLNPVIVHFYQSDIAKGQRENWQRRGDNWKNWQIDRYGSGAYCINRNLKGEEAVIRYWQGLSELSIEIFEELAFPKLKIENSEYNWDDYKKRILNFLEVKKVDEKLFEKSYEKYCGCYGGIKIHIKKERLCFDEFWADIKLLPLENDEFELEGFPVNIKFNFDQNGTVSSMTFSKALGDYEEGSVRKRIYPVDLSLSQLNIFCGYYWCEAEKLDRKIYLKDGTLYYWRNEDSESKLIPVAENELVMSGNGAVLSFDFADKCKTFILHSEDKDDSIFATYEAPDICPVCSGKAKITQNGENLFAIKCFTKCHNYTVEARDIFQDLSEKELTALAETNEYRNYIQVPCHYSRASLKMQLAEFQIIEEIITEYDFDEVELCNAGGCNDLIPNYQIGQNDSYYSLRFYNHQRSLESIQNELVWLDKLKENGVRISEIIPDLAGNEIHFHQKSGRYCVVKSWVHGELLLKIPATKRPDNFIEQLGELMAKIHQVSESLTNLAKQTFEKRDYQYYHDLYNKLKLKEFASPDAKNSFIKHGEKFLQVISDLKSDRSSFGLIHGDLTYRNLLLHGDALVADNFTSVRQDFFLTEIAHLFNQDLAENELEKFWIGYEKVNPVTAEWKRIFPVFLDACKIGLIFNMKKESTK